MRDFAQQLSPRWTGFVSEKRFSEGIFRKSDFAIQRVTKPLLYQLSYVGAERQRLHPLASDSSSLTSSSDESAGRNSGGKAPGNRTITTARDRIRSRSASANGFS